MTALKVEMKLALLVINAPWSKPIAYAAATAAVGVAIMTIIVAKATLSTGKMCVAVSRNNRTRLISGTITTLFQE